MERHEDRRKNSGLTEEEIEAIKEAILDSIYEEIGRSVVRKILWTVGSIILAVGAWLGVAHVSFK